MTFRYSSFNFLYLRTYSNHVRFLRPAGVSPNLIPSPAEVRMLCVSPHIHAKFELISAIVPTDSTVPQSVQHPNPNPKKDEGCAWKLTALDPAVPPAIRNMLLNQQFLWSIYPEGDSADGSRIQLSVAPSAPAASFSNSSSPRLGVWTTGAAVDRKPLASSSSSSPKSLSATSARDQSGVFRDRINKWSVVVFVPADYNKVIKQIAKKRRLTGKGSGNSCAPATTTADSGSGSGSGLGSGSGSGSGLGSGSGSGGSHYFVGRFDTEAEARVVYKRVSTWWELSF